MIAAFRFRLAGITSSLLPSSPSYVGRALSMNVGKNESA
jgi:hypothetical protein